MRSDYYKLLFRAWKYRLFDDGPEIRFLLGKIKKGAVAFDAGAHKGGYTFWMKKAVGSSGKVIAFEPQQSGALLLKELFADTIVQVEHQALSNREGITKLFVQPQEWTVSFEASLENKYGTAYTEEVQTTTIDGYCSKHQLIPSFIKIDVEGHEKQVLEGAVHILKEHHPVLLVEAEVRHSDVEGVQSIFDFLSTLGYKGSFFFRGSQLPIESFDASLHQSIDLVGKAGYSNNFIFES